MRTGFCHHPKGCPARGQIEEVSPHDYFWGTGFDGTGLNHLGRLLMSVRADLLATEADRQTLVVRSLYDISNSYNKTLALCCEEKFCKMLLPCCDEVVQSRETFPVLVFQQVLSTITLHDKSSSVSLQEYICVGVWFFCSSYESPATCQHNVYIFWNVMKCTHKQIASLQSQLDCNKIVYNCD